MPMISGQTSLTTFTRMVTLDDSADFVPEKMSKGTRDLPTFNIKMTTELADFV